MSSTRKELFNPDIEWQSQQEIHFQDIKVTGVLNLEKISVDGVIPDTGKVIKMQADGVIGVC